MQDFDALLKRSFAEAEEPADNGFAVRVEQVVARRESALQIRNVAQSVGLAAAGAAICYGLWGALAPTAPEVMATAGLELARAHGALSQAPTLEAQASAIGTGFMQTMGAAMTQILLVAATLAGGAVAYRTVQQD